MIQVDIGLLGVVLGICFSFLGLVLASKITGFGASSKNLAVIAAVSVPLGFIPAIGGVLSLVVTFILLRQISKEGVILMMIVSFIMMLAVAMLIVKTL